MAGGNGADHCAGPTAVLLQMIQGEGQDLVRSKPGAIFINNAKAIRIPVQAQADLRFTAPHKPAHFSHSFGVRLRMMAAEQRVELVVKHGHFGPVLFE